MLKLDLTQLYKGLMIKSIFLLSFILVPCFTNAALQTHLTLDNTLNDASGNGNNGVFPGGSSNPSYATAALNQGLNFDGSNDYITINDFDPGSSFSAALWVRMDSLNSMNTFIEHIRTNRRNEFYIGYDNTLGELFVELQDTNTAEDDACGDPKFCTGISLIADRWYHIAVTVTPTNLSVYIDSELAYSVTHSTTVTFNPGAWLVGGDSDSNPFDTPNGDYLDGRLDDIRIYDHALTQAEVSATMDLHGFWKFDDCTWSPSASITDNTGNSLTGTIFGAVSSATGQICTAASMSGIDADYINVPNNSLLDITDELTVMTWIKADALPSSGLKTIVSKDWNYELHINSSGNVFWSWNDSSSGVHSLTSSNTLTPGNWYHIAIVYSQSNSQQRIYINGVQRASSSLSQSLRLFSGPLQIGADQGASGQNFDGLIDEVKVFNRSLTNEEISDYFTTPNPISRTCPTCTGGGSALISYYQLDEASWDGSANEVVDSSGNSNHGQSIGGITTDGALPAVTGDPGTCRYAEITSNTSSATFQAADTGVDINDDVGTSGTISFWYKSNVRWNGNNGDRQLLDASKAGADNKFFYFVLLNSSRLEFGLEDSNDNNYTFTTTNNNFSANTWVHVAITWDLVNRQMQIFRNAGSPTTFTIPASTTGILGELNSLYLGDNRSSYIDAGMTGNSANGAIDEARIYSEVRTQVQIQTDMNATHPCATTLDHILIEHDGTALTCEPESITVKACANTDCSSLFTSDVSVTLTPSGWVGGDTQTVTSGSSVFQLRTSTASTITLGVSSSTPSAANSALCTNTSTATNSCALEFFDTGFIFDVSTLTACQTSANVTISAVRLDVTSQQCVPSFQNRNETINFWSTYSDPNSGTKQVILNNGSNNFTLATSSPGTGVLLSFDNNGETTATVTYADAGQMMLNNRFDGSGAEASLVMTGSDNFLAKPAALRVYSDDSNSDCTSGDATCSAFKKVGENFNLKIQAVCADLSTDNPNFRLNSIGVTHSLIAPGGGTAGAIGVSSFNMVAADTGEHIINNQTVSEVGVFTFTATPPASAYFGETVADGTSVNIGRFTPDHFTLSNISLINRSDIVGCTDSFTYMDENFRTNFDLTAQASAALSNTTTQNYTGSFAKLDPTILASMNYGTTNASTDLTSRLNVASIGSFTNGIANIQATLSFARTANPDGPFNPLGIGIAPQDSDTIVLNSFDLSLDGGSNTHGRLGQTDVRFGRAIIENAFGSEFLSLSVPLRTEYYVSSTTGFNINSADNCTALTTGLLDLQNAGDNPAPGVPTIQIGTSSTTASIANNPVTAGDSNLNFSAPNQTGFTNIDLDLSTLPFLQYDWDNNGTHNNNPPTVRATFGSYRGDDRVIYWREIFQ